MTGALVDGEVYISRSPRTLKPTSPPRQNKLRSGFLVTSQQVCIVSCIILQVTASLELTWT